MAKTCEELWEEFRRSGTRTYRDARELLLAWGFHERVTPRGHAVWDHPRGLTLTLTTRGELKTYLRKYVERAIEQLQLVD